MGDTTQIHAKGKVASQMLEDLASAVDMKNKNKELQSRVDVLENCLHQIKNWCKAYPLDIAPEPDLIADRKLLGDGEFSCLNISAMRHVTNGIQEIINGCLPDQPISIEEELARR